MGGGRAWRTCGIGQHLFDLTMMNYVDWMSWLWKHCERFSANAASLYTSLPNIFNALKQFSAIMRIRVHRTYLIQMFRLDLTCSAYWSYRCPLPGSYQWSWSCFSHLTTSSTRHLDGKKFPGFRINTLQLLTVDRMNYMLSFVLYRKLGNRKREKFVCSRRHL